MNHKSFLADEGERDRRLAEEWASQFGWYAKVLSQSPVRKPLKAAKVSRCEATYYRMAGSVVVDRSLYREVGQRNAKVVDPVSLRAGVVENGWLSRTASAMAASVLPRGH